MYGAILGDIIGSPYEFDRGAKIKAFPLFIEKSRFTDDTVMTIAVADALLYAGKDATEDKIHPQCSIGAGNILKQGTEENSVSGSKRTSLRHTAVSATARPCG